jgi:hypothetical protein
MRLTGCQREPHRKPVGIDDRMNLAGQTASGTLRHFAATPDVGRFRTEADMNR